MTQLAAGVLKELLSTTGVAAEEVNEVILGQVGDKITDNNICVAVVGHD